MALLPRDDDDRWGERRRRTMMMDDGDDYYGHCFYAQYLFKISTLNNVSKLFLTEIRHGLRRP